MGHYHHQTEKNISDQKNNCFQYRDEGEKPKKENVSTFQQCKPSSNNLIIIKNRIKYRWSEAFTSKMYDSFACRGQMPFAPTSV